MIKAQHSFFLTVFILLMSQAVSRDIAWAQDDYPPEIGGEEAWDEKEDDLEFNELDNLDTRLDLSANYTRFTGEDMNKTYGGIPQVSVGLNFRTTRHSRLFISCGYGQAQGDPFYGTPGITVEDQIQVRYLPFQLGMKYDLANSSKVHVYAGFGLEFAWMEETVPLQGENGEVTDTSSSGFNNGYLWIFGPEFILGQGGQALGLEVGWGGSKGTITSEGHSHDLDMTGYRGRIYFVVPL